MTTNIFKNLRNHYQILDRILVYLPEKFEKCYLGKTTTLFTAGLRLPLMTLHRQLANFLRLFVSQVTPIAWRIFIGAKILWGRLSGGNHQLSLDKFFWCYRPQHIISSQGIYYFVARKKELGLCQICLIPIEIGREDISLFRGRIGYAVQRSGLRCLMASTILGVLSKIQV